MQLKKCNLRCFILSVVSLLILSANISVKADDYTVIGFGTGGFIYNKEYVHVTLREENGFGKWIASGHEAVKFLKDSEKFCFKPSYGNIIDYRNYDKYLNIDLAGLYYLVVTDSGICYLTSYAEREKNPKLQIIISQIEDADELDRWREYMNSILDNYNFMDGVFDNSDLKLNVTRGEFVSAVGSYLNNLIGIDMGVHTSYGDWPFLDDASKHVNDLMACDNIGIIKGIYRSDSGKVYMGMQESLDREQMYVMLSRLTKYFINNMSADENLHYDYKLPGDIKDFSDWARDDILFLTEIGLTEPDKNNNLNPKSYVTVEEMKKTGNKVYKYIKRFIDRDMFVTGYAKEYGDKYQIYNWYDYMNRDKGIPKLEYPTEK